MNWFMTVLKKYAVFNGRARRKEYWMFFLVYIIIVIVLSIIGSLMGMGTTSGQNLLVTVFQLAMLVPSIAVGVRRMHDTDHSGWWILLPIVNLIFACTAGTHGDNQFGPDPKASSEG